MLKVTTDEDLTNEAIRSLYVRSFLTAAVYRFRKDVIIMPQRILNGEVGNGPVDFAIESRHTRATVAVTEVKNEDLKKGIAQNIVQLATCLVSVTNVFNERINSSLSHANSLFSN